MTPHAVPDDVPTTPPEKQAHLDTLLKEHFGWDGFRPMQREVIESVLQGNSCLAVLPTGGGKSLCYQLPALALPGITLVISPLISLMKDQVDALHDRKISAVAINSHDTFDEMEMKLAAVRSGQVHLVYVAPERLKNGAFLATCRQAKVRLIAVDEAHCVSQWGHDFRPDYRFIKDFREAVDNPPLLALTATATERVQRDIASHLGIEDGDRYIAGVDRPNLWFGIEHCSKVVEKRGKIVSLVERTEGSAIVYTSSRREADELATIIQNELGEPVASYHAGLSADQRTSVQNRFMAGLVRVVTATNAFGMGIDKPDIRAVIHAGIPESVEAYYQEVGRAGRDGEPAECTVVVVPGMDVKMREYLLQKDDPTREQVNALLDKVADATDHDIAVVPLGDTDAAIGTLILSHLQALGQLELIQRTSSGMRIRTMGDLTHDIRENVWVQIQEHVRAKWNRFRRLRNFIYLDETQCRRQFLLRYFDDQSMSDSDQCCSGCSPRPVKAKKIARPSKRRRRQKAQTGPSPAQRSVDPVLFEALREWRLEQAREREVPAYVIFGDRDLEGIAAARPQTREQLAACRGVGPVKLELYADDILEIVRKHADKGGQADPSVAAALAQGKTPKELAEASDRDFAAVWQEFLSWLQETDEGIWKQQVRWHLSPEEYVQIRAELRGYLDRVPDELLSDLERRFDPLKVDVARAVMVRVGER